MTSLCGLLGKSKQAYYKHDDTLPRRLAEENFCLEFIKSVRRKDPGIGGGKLWKMYRKEFGPEHSVGYNRFYDIIEKYGLKVRKKKRRAHTTDSNHGLPTYPDLTRNLIPDAANKLWVSDITYIKIWRGPGDDDYDFCYLSLVTDYYSKKIVGYCVAPDLSTAYALKALRMAVNSLPDPSLLAWRLIHHSDRGVQYASLDYTRYLKKLHVRISMTETGDPKDNAVAERVNNTIKNELLMGMRFTSIGKVRKAVKAAVDFYNNERPHMSLDWMTPNEASVMTGQIEKKWTSYREKAIGSCPA